MLSVEQASKTILSHVSVLSPEELPLLKSLGQVSAEDIYADLNVPSWDSAAVDGYAVMAEDLQGASRHNPSVLQVIETVKAGTTAKYMVSPGVAIRIMTGALLPPGADSVVRFEDTDREKRLRNSPETASSEIGIELELGPGMNIRRAGENLPQGSRIVSKGSVIGPAEANLLSSQGYTKAKVIHRPVVAIIATGEELAMPGRTLSSPQVFNGNSFSLAAQVLRCGGLPKILGIARDTKSSLLSKIRRGIQADILIISGGVSMGDYDLVKKVMAELGEIVFWQVRMNPGRPFAFALLHRTGIDGQVKKVPHLALTGNPTAGMVNFEVLVRPAILKMTGRINVAPKMIEAVSENPLDNKSGLRRYIWVKLERREGCYYAIAASLLTKGVLPSIALADGLAVISEETSRVEKGDRLPVILLDWR